MFFWHDRRDLSQGSMTRCFTDSRGGVSEAPFSSFNLAQHVGDDAARIEQNRALLSAQLGDVPIAWMNQVHRADVAVVDETTYASVHNVDALVTADADLALAVMVADCTPVLLEDAEAGVIGCAHAGRPGMRAGVVVKALEAMRDLGARNISATLGPSICGRCYEVPMEMRDDSAQVYPETAAITWQGTPAIDVAAGVAAQLAKNDIPLTWVPGCTRETPSLYSYRRDGQTGRYAGVIVRHVASMPTDFARTPDA